MMKPIVNEGDYILSKFLPNDDELEYTVWNRGIVEAQQLLEAWLDSVDPRRTLGYSYRIAKVFVNSKYNRHSPKRLSVL